MASHLPFQRPHSSAPSHIIDLENREELEREGKGCITFCLSLGCPDTGQLCTDNRRVSLGDENPLWQIIESMRIFNNNVLLVWSLLKYAYLRVYN